MSHNSAAPGDIFLHYDEVVYLDSVSHSLFTGALIVSQSTAENSPTEALVTSI